MPFDILIRGGTVVDPSQQLNAVRDVAVEGGKIAAIDQNLDPSLAVRTFDARGLLVTPGLIDMHAHVDTNSPMGLDPDVLSVAGGVTTILDAGSAGSYNFDAFRRHVLDRCTTDVVALVNLSCIGLIAAHLGELRDRRYADPDGVVATIRRHSDVAVGVKIRAGAHIIGSGEQGWANLRDAIAAAREAGVWLMVHIGECPMPIPELVDQLQPGDCLTHCFKGGSTRVTDDDGQIWDRVRAAADRGVVFDVGHGFGSFHWDVATAAVEQGFLPSTISTDLHQKNLHGPVYDMPTTMSKFLHLGVPLNDVIQMSTTRPASVLGREDELGNLRVGTVADITVLEKHEGQFELTDSYRQTRIGHELLVAAATVRRGELAAGGGGTRMRHFPS